MMVNSKFLASQMQRSLLMVVYVVVGLSSASLVAQDSYYNNSYRIYSGQPAARVARANPPRKSNLPQAFQVDVNDSRQAAPARTASTNVGAPSSTALANAFSTGDPRTVKTSGRLQDVFGENPKEDPFGENNIQPQPGNPFKKIDAQENAAPATNPFGEMPAREAVPQQQSPFSEMPQNPNLNTPPMDTDPVRPLQQVAPMDPPGTEFTPNPDTIDPNPPIPGEPQRPLVDQRPNDDEGEGPDLTDQDQTDPGEISDDPESSIFDSGEPDDADVPPVPAPRSSQVYLPARDPTDYARRPSDPTPPSYDPRKMQNNPYANLPGPYGYPAQQPYPGYPPHPYPGYPPNPYAAMMAAMPYGQCGPGCAPINASNNCNSCGSPPGLSPNNCGGCNSCNSCGGGGSRPTLPGSDIGERIVETAEVACGPETTYVDVVSDCDDACSNFASCYIGVFGGWSDLNDFVTRDEIGTGVYFEDSGYLFGIAVGQIQGRNLRTELELSYRNIDVNGLRLNGSAPSQFIGANGDFGTFAGMVNGYWEFVDFRTEKIKPYIGGGIGFAIARPNLIQPSGAEAVITDDESSFAWQWMVGLNYKASPTLDAFVEYRYFTADSFRLDTQIPEVAGLGNGSGSFDYQSSNVLFGLRARF